ncbi:hypothetical protein MLP_37550 [Microlunatus phosphovorus NM-1]|uniref:inorganic diphosphatase n=1 Tax=Microlunatus phosphovorus (strain ATCC 700054 / DSM 10555 / JCM 9379 / NBRC 101784 / NCIMB 13414 / VKM Ac-1990 / NM-1) TaxID=1032480 RepID=F5XPC9_MICPN|nr:inorganic diphosphatase [Microlunatus phosphovorus]BAK36769.1 hypothetical protein MLP_37550 [Microlunatus phosphovorus NM-1]
MTDASSEPFFEALVHLVQTSEVVIDRPRGTTHPRIPNAIYPVDYGYLEGTMSADGDGIDVFVGTDGSAGVVAILLTVDRAKRDTEVKVLLNCTPGEVSKVQRFVKDVLKIGGLLVEKP